MKKLIILLIVSFLILVGCQAKGIDINNRIIKEIDNKSDQSNTCQISMKDITNFKWDKMVIFQVGSSNDEVSKVLGVEYKDSTDLTSGMIFVYENKIVHQERILYDPEHPSKLNYVIEKKPNEPNCVSFSPDNAILKGSKEIIDKVIYYRITAVIN